jgi:hypothetical protein
VQDIRAQLEATAVRPIFDSIHQNGRRDQSLPEVVLENRKNRAYGRVLDALSSRGAATIPAGLRTSLESMIETWSSQAFDDAFQPIQEFEIQCGVASALHEKHEAEMPESDVVRHFAAMLPQMGQPQEDALRIVREIRDRSGLLVERRPGAFAFSHLTFQEYLTALDYASRTQELLAHADDPWWHEVIALAAGIPGCSAAEIIECFLRRGRAEDIFMATKCLETAVSVPLALRKEVENALGRALPGISGEL